MYILGIDPGAQGAIACATYNSDMGAIYRFWKMPDGPAGLHALLRDEFDPCAGPGFAYVEQVGQFNPRSEPHLVLPNLKLREALGIIKGVLVAHDIALEKPVTPNTWQKFIAPGMPCGRESAAKRKAGVHEAIRQRIPANRCAFALKVTGIPKYAADAFGILLYGMAKNAEWQQKQRRDAA